MHAPALWHPPAAPAAIPCQTPCMSPCCRPALSCRRRGQRAAAAGAAGAGSCGAGPSAGADDTGMPCCLCFFAGLSTVRCTSCRLGYCWLAKPIVCQAWPRNLLTARRHHPSPCGQFLRPSDPPGCAVFSAAAAIGHGRRGMLQPDTHFPSISSLLFPIHPFFSVLFACLQHAGSALPLRWPALTRPAPSHLTPPSTAQPVPGGGRRGALCAHAAPPAVGRQGSQQGRAARAAGEGRGCGAALRHTHCQRCAAGGLKCANRKAPMSVVVVAERAACAKRQRSRRGGEGCSAPWPRHVAANPAMRVAAAASR